MTEEAASFLEDASEAIGRGELDAYLAAMGSAEMLSRQALYAAGWACGFEWVDSQRLSDAVEHLYPLSLGIVAGQWVMFDEQGHRLPSQHVDAWQGFMRDNAASLRTAGRVIASECGDRQP